MLWTIPYVQHHPIQTIALAPVEEMAMAEYEDLRQRHLADLTTRMPEHVQRLRWPAERLRRERRDRLRDLLRVAGRLRPGIANGWPGSTPAASRRPTWPACRR